MSAKTQHPSREILAKWLEKVGAVFQWCEPIAGFGEISRYVANGRTFLLHSMETRDRDFGWEIYVPAHDGNETEKTLEAAEAALGLRTTTPEGGTVNTAQVLDVANVLAHLRREHSIDPDPVVGILDASDYSFIAEAVSRSSNTVTVAREVAERVRARQTG